jgi:four helix bundle protein
MPVLHYRELHAWQRAMDLVEAVYLLSSGFPDDERFGLTNQIRRAAVSVPSNIAEGQGRASTAEFLNFLSIANGSRQEVETQAMIAVRLGFVPQSDAADVLALAEETGRLIAGLTRSLS